MSTTGFANYKTIIMTDQTTNKKKGVGGKRVMHTQHASTWDAKNRWCLPPEVPFEYASIAPYIPDLGEPPVLIDSPQGSVPLPPDPSPEEEAFWDIQDNPTAASQNALQPEVIATAAQVNASYPEKLYSSMFTAQNISKPIAEIGRASCRERV